MSFQLKEIILKGVSNINGFFAKATKTINDYNKLTDEVLDIYIKLYPKNGIEYRTLKLKGYITEFGSELAYETMKLIFGL